MLDIIAFVFASAIQAAAPEAADQSAAPADTAAAVTTADAGLVAEPQVPSGKFTTAVEVKPILAMTSGSWVAVREYDGRDLLYVTHIWSWRCGLVAMTVAINGAPAESWDLPVCHEDDASPNAIKDEDGLPFRSFPLGALETIDVELVFDDLTREAHKFERAQVLMP